jgi:hypothetical protein
VLLLGACGAPSVPAADDAGTYERLGAITDRQLSEVSGIALSQRDENVIFAVNDSDNAAVVHAIGLDGGRLASLEVAGVPNVDWEDMASFTLDGRHWLAIADIGDNLGRRPWVSVVVVPEPDLASPPDVLTPSRILRFRYPDGPRDAEGLAVDVDRREFLVLSKRQMPPDLFAVPLEGDGRATGGALTARRLGAVEGLPPPTAAELAADPLTGLYGAQPTALDYRADVGLVVLTYRRPYVFPIVSGGGMAESLARGPVAVEMPRLNQAEALTIRGRRLLVTSERLPAPLLSLPLPPAPAPAGPPAPAGGPDGTLGGAPFLDLVN